MRQTEPAPSDHDPGTPDSDVTLVRLAGREAYRRAIAGGLKRGDRVNLAEVADVPKGERTAWWLGWYDERLKRFYGRT